MAMTTILVDVNPTTRVGTLTLNRPDKRNALSHHMVEEIHAAMIDLNRDDRVGVIVLRGAGEVFCSGADLAEIQAMQTASYDDNLANSRALRDALGDFYASPKPTIAALHGPALAGGAGIATACDFIIASEDATFGYPEVRIGFVAALVMVLLTRQIGERKARDLLLTGRKISAQEAHELGIYNKVVHAEDLDDEVAELAEVLVKNSPQAMALTKQLLTEVWDGPFEQNLDEAARRNARARSGTDCMEGIASFLEKRKPNFGNDPTFKVSKA